MTTPIEHRSLSELRDLDDNILQRLRNSDHALLELDERSRLMALRVDLVGQMGKLTNPLYNPAADNNQRLRSNDYQLPEPTVDPAPALPSLQHIQELKDSVAGLDDTSPRYCAVMARVKLDQQQIDDAAAAKEAADAA